MLNIVSIIIVAVLSVLGNIAYFEYQSHKKTSKDLLKQKLTNLLLPLYVALHLEESAAEASTLAGDEDYASLLSDLPTRVLLPAEKIIKENIYLADDKMHEACIEFLQWAYRSDANERYNELMEGNFSSTTNDNDFKKFYDIVISEYNKTRKRYLGL